MTVLVLLGCNVRFLVTWLMTAHYSPAGRTRGTVLLGFTGGVLIVATWFGVDCCHMVCHEIFSLETSCPCGIQVLFWYLVGFCCLLREVVWCHLGLCVAHVGVVVLVIFLIGILCPHMVPHSEVA